MFYLRYRPYNHIRVSNINGFIDVLGVSHDFKTHLRMIRIVRSEFPIFEKECVQGGFP